MSGDSDAGVVRAEHFAADQVRLNMGDATSGKQIANLARYHDPENQMLRGSNGQIEWRYGRGLFLLKAPGSQGVCGFLGEADTTELPDLNVNLGLPFGTVWAVAMDDKPLASSRKILLQVMSEQRNTGFETRDEGPWRVVTAGGEAPVIVRQFAGNVAFKGAAGDLSVTALDINGVPMEKLGSAANIPLRPDAVYYFLEAPSK